MYEVGQQPLNLLGGQGSAVRLNLLFLCSSSSLTLGAEDLLAHLVEYGFEELA